MSACFTVSINLILAYAHLILALEGIQDPEIKDASHDCFFGWQSEVQDVDCRSEHHVHDEHYYEEFKNGTQCLEDEVDVKGCHVK